MNYKSVTIGTKEPYPVITGDNLIEKCGILISKEIKPCRAAVISDENVMRLYGERVKSSLQDAGFRVFDFEFPAGEKSKSPDTVIRILDYLASSGFDRSDVIIALGGGVTGDIAGFASAIYMRGINLVQIPTSLLAMVDSSVGGKTGVNLSGGKNLAGAFKQPRFVLCDTKVLEGLPDEQFSCGMAEIIKYAVISDEKLFDLLSQTHGKTGFSEETLTKIIVRCVEIKGNIVARDEFDCGERQLLNFGHTIGHAIEKASGYTIGHGQAISIGMVMMTDLSEKLGICPMETKKRLIEVLGQFDLSHEIDIPAKTLSEAIVIDKKRRGDEMTLVMPKKIGTCFCKNFPMSQIEGLIRVIKEERQ